MRIDITAYTHVVEVGDVVFHSRCIIGANSFVDIDIFKNKIIVLIPRKEMIK